MSAAKLSPLATAFKTVRDATVCDDSISNADKIAVLELVKQELLQAMLEDVRVESEETITSDLLTALYECVYLIEQELPDGRSSGEVKNARSVLSKAREAA